MDNRLLLRGCFHFFCVIGNDALPTLFQFFGGLLRGIRVAMPFVGVGIVNGILALLLCLRAAIQRLPLEEHLQQVVHILLSELPGLHRGRGQRRSKLFHHLGIRVDGQLALLACPVPGEFFGEGVGAFLGLGALLQEHGLVDAGLRRGVCLGRTAAGQQGHRQGGGQHAHGFLFHKGTSFLVLGMVPAYHSPRKKRLPAHYRLITASAAGFLPPSPAPVCWSAPGCRRGRRRSPLPGPVPGRSLRTACCGRGLPCKRGP